MLRDSSCARSDSVHAEMLDVAAGKISRLLESVCEALHAEVRKSAPKHDASFELHE